MFLTHIGLTWMTKSTECRVFTTTYLITFTHYTVNTSGTLSSFIYKSPLTRRVKQFSWILSCKPLLSWRYYLLHTELQFDLFFNSMFDWFKKKDSRWMASEEGIRMLEEVKNKVDQIPSSIWMNYLSKITKIVEFIDVSTQEMSEKLKSQKGHCRFRTCPRGSSL